MDQHSARCGLQTPFWNTGWSLRNHLQPRGLGPGLPKGLTQGHNHNPGKLSEPESLSGEIPESDQKQPGRGDICLEEPWAGLVGAGRAEGKSAGQQAAALGCADGGGGDDYLLTKGSNPTHIVSVLTMTLGGKKFYPRSADRELEVQKSKDTVPILHRWAHTVSPTAGSGGPGHLSVGSVVDSVRRGQSDRPWATHTQPSGLLRTARCHTVQARGTRPYSSHLLCPLRLAWLLLVSGTGSAALGRKQVGKLRSGVCQRITRSQGLQDSLLQC